MSATIELREKARLEWSELPGARIMEIGPPEGSFIELPGPKRIPVRPQLEPFAGPDGVAIRVLGGNAEPMPLTVTPDQPVVVKQLPEAPLAVNVGEDGRLWVLTRGSLRLQDRDGTALGSLAISGMTLVGAGAGAVWVVGQDSASFVDHKATLRARFPWKGGFGSAGSAGAICALEKGQPQIRLLDPDGRQRTLALGRTPGPFEQLISVSAGVVITRAGAQLRRYAGEDVPTELTLQAAGLTAQGVSFASGRTGGFVELWLSGGVHRRLPLPKNAPEQRALPVVAVDGTRCLVYGLDFSVWYEGDRAGRTLLVDDDTYRSEIFPHLWSLNPAHIHADRDGEIILPASGPAAAVLLGLSWNGH